jgi:hypothetical protein
MWAATLGKNDGAHFRPAVRRLLHPYGWAKRIHLIIDNGASHTSDDTTAFFRDLRRASMCCLRRSMRLGSIKPSLC